MWTIAMNAKKKKKNQEIQTELDTPKSKIFSQIFIFPFKAPSQKLCFIQWNLNHVNNLDKSLKQTIASKDTVK